MSEIKGTLLGIVLAISVFTIVFGLIEVAVKKSAKTVSDRLEESVALEPEVSTNTALAYNYHF